MKKIDEEYNVIWSLTGNQSNAWYQTSVRVGRVSRPFSLVISATRNFDILGNEGTIYLRVEYYEISLLYVIVCR